MRSAQPSARISRMLERRSRHATFLAWVLMTAAARDARGQVVPGVGMPRADARSETARYRLGVEAELLAVVDAWGRFAEQKDSASLASLFTQSAKSVSPGLDDAWGPADIVRQLWQLSFRGARMSVISSDFDASGDMGYLSCTITVQPTPEGGPAATVDARAVFILLRDFRGQWRIRHQTIVIAPHR